ncbi:MAG: FtsL-like putative cell division protein [Bacteroidia bacterium]|nr:FtsL-like putative cell division protein [Bacteroidia bacterium]
MKTWKIADIWTFITNSFKAILKGEFLLRLNIGRYFAHIVYTFFLFAMVIWLSLMIETSMAKVEKNKAVLRELEIQHSQKTFEVVKLSRRSQVESELKRMGSNIGEPQRPAIELK